MECPPVLLVRRTSAAVTMWPNDPVTPAADNSLFDLWGDPGEDIYESIRSTGDEDFKKQVDEWLASHRA
ncbi:hypothetical protein KEM60_00275 [Austwickia sp. TVS 96-490-7B]|nr:hypothetical protein [Austwickia sp. TVS 96-490-7B]